MTQLKKKKLDKDFSALTPSITHAEILAEIGRYQGEDGDFFFYDSFPFEWEFESESRNFNELCVGKTPKKYEHLKKCVKYWYPDHFESKFNSVIAHHNNWKKYAKDQYDFDNNRAVLSFKKGRQDGFLVFPEYNIAFPIQNESILIYKSSGLLNGITPGSDQRSIIFLLKAHGKKRNDKSEPENNDSDQGSLLVR